MHVIVVRHGIAHDRLDPLCPPDEERALTSDGIKKTRQALRGFSSLDIIPTVILSSPWRRARETAEIFREEVMPSLPLVFDDVLLHDAPGNAIDASLARQPDGDVVLVGHAPNLDEICAHLVGAPPTAFALKKAAICVIGFSGRAEAGTGSVVALLSPKVLRALGKSTL